MRGRGLLVGLVTVTTLAAGPATEAPEETRRLHGNPAAAVEWAIDQPAKGLCGPAAVGMIVAGLTGRDPGRRAVAWAAERLGMLDYDLGGGVHGMWRDSLPGLFAAFGVRAESGRTGLWALRPALDAGAGIVLHVDSRELWGTGDGRADHFVVLTGIDDRAGVAVLNDPGRAPAYGFAAGSGAGTVLPLDALEDAWEDSGRWATVARAPVTIVAA